MRPTMTCPRCERVVSLDEQARIWARYSEPKITAKKAKMFLARMNHIGGEAYCLPCYEIAIDEMNAGPVLAEGQEG